MASLTTSDPRRRKGYASRKQSIRSFIMNLALIDPFQLAQDFPDTVTDDLSKFSIVFTLTDDSLQASLLTSVGSGHATTLRFNRKGDYLASGRVDGKVIIW